MVPLQAISNRKTPFRIAAGTLGLCLLMPALCAQMGVIRHDLLHRDRVGRQIDKLRSPKLDVRVQASQALAAIGEPAVEPMIDALKDRDWRVREGVADALGDIKDSRAVEPLLIAVRDADPHVRESAAGSLGQLKDASAVPALTIALKDKFASVRAAAAFALGLIADPDAVQSLALALKDPDYEVVAMSAGALDRIGAPAVDALVALLHSPTVTLRTSAALALNRSKDPRAVAALMAALKAPDLAVVAGAYSFYIRGAVPLSEGTLIAALDKYGDRNMAQDYLNCGNVSLSVAAEDWARKRGIKVERIDLGANSSALGSGHWGSKN
jgi:HEAT repeat protein